MPAGMNWELGVHYLAFGGVKLAGYTGFGVYLNKSYAPDIKPPKAATVGVARTAIGVAFGLTYGFLAKLIWDDPTAALLFYGGLLPLRAIEWAIIVRFFYDPVFKNRKRLWQTVARGTVVSYVLDIPAAFGFLTTGGMWIC